MPWKRGKSIRLSWSRLILAVEPGRLPPSDRLGKDHGWERAFTPHLNSKTPAHLDHMRPLVTRIGLLDRLRMTREYVLEETPVWSTTQEVLAHGHESIKVHDGVWGKVVELRPKEVQETSKERVGRQGKPAVDVSSEENMLTLLWLWLGLVPRESRRFVGDQSPLDQVVDVVLTDRRANPVALDPARRQAEPRGRSAPVRLLPLRLRCRSEQSSNGAVALEQEQMQRRKLRGREKNGDALFKNPGPTPYMESLSSD